MEYIGNLLPFPSPPPTYTSPPHTHFEHPTFIDVDKYEQLKLAASKFAESEKIIEEHLKIKAEPHHQEETHLNSDLEQTEEVLY